MSPSRLVRHPDDSVASAGLGRGVSFFLAPIHARTTEGDLVIIHLPTTYDPEGNRTRGRAAVGDLCVHQLRFMAMNPAQAGIDVVGPLEILIRQAVASIARRTRVARLACELMAARYLQYAASRHDVGLYR